ncbi:MAG: sigma-54 interaction domain-containing protein [Moorellaceae bacterium]
MAHPAGVTVTISSEMEKDLYKLVKSRGMDIGDVNGWDINGLLASLIRENEEYRAKLRELENELSALKEKTVEAFDIGDAILDGLIMLDKNGIITAVNKIFLHLARISDAKEIIGKHIGCLVKGKYIDKDISKAALRTRAKISDMVVMVRSDKTTLATCNPFLDEKGEIIKCIIVMRDLTELIRLKEELEKSKQLTTRYFNELKYWRRQQCKKAGLIGDSPAMQKVKELIYQVSQVDATVLIIGETGVGKEVVANEIHKNSSRCDGPFIKVNCAAIPETLLESELFGYEKGAFTGALNKEKPGLFELANKGTILLDEIGEMPLHLQAKLLRVLQEREIIRVGGTAPIKLDVRVIASTNRDLLAMVRKGTFREDLYYRLHVLPIVIPPLRERKEDIPALALHFLEKYNKKYNTHKTIHASGLDLLKQYHWPGNVRELENLIERLVITAKENDLSSEIRGVLENKRTSDAPYLLGGNKVSLRETVKLLEKQIIEQALREHGSTHKAARALGVSQPTLVRKVKKLGIRQ